MQTRFSDAQLRDQAMAASEQVLRTCVHCGFCTATCPTYVLLGDELDSPRGRIYLIKDMLENERLPSPEVVKHVDRCLSCLSCMTTCPSGVNYMHLVDHARSYITTHYRRPWGDRLLRGLLTATLPHPKRFRLALKLARLARPLAQPIGRVTALKPLATMLRLAPRHLPAPAPHLGIKGGDRGRVALLGGCAEAVLDPGIRAATLRLVGRMGYEVVFAPGEGCCGALVHHMGREAAALESARRNVEAWSRLIDNGGLEAILITTSGCGTTIKDYGFMLRGDPAYAERAARVSALARDISEFLHGSGLPPTMRQPGLSVAYHAACSLHHGQRVKAEPKNLLTQAGFTVKDVAEGHLCCGSAGTYNLLQPDIADQLRARKVANIDKTGADLIAAGNIGCITQIAAGTGRPIVHTVELLDWVTGGPPPAAIAHLDHPRGA